MKSLLRVLIFLLAFQIEIKVSAQGPKVLTPLQCVRAATDCAFKAHNGSFHFQSPQGNINLAENAVVHKNATRGEAPWTFINGDLWFEKVKETEVSFLFGSVSARGGDFWLLSNEDQRVRIRNISAELKITLKDGSQLGLPPGFEFWVGGVAEEGKNQYGMLEPVRMTSHLKLWSSLYRGTKDGFLAEAQELRRLSKQSIVEGSKIYQESVDRNLASVEEKQKTQARAEAARIQENKRLRDLFYKRSFER